jgi:Phage terminase large subunit (GpA)
MHQLRRARQAIDKDLSLWRPPPKLNLIQWADTFRRVAAKTSASPGRWKTSSQPVAFGPMSAVLDPGTNTVSVMAGTQILKTEFCSTWRCTTFTKTLRRFFSCSQRRVQLRLSRRKDLRRPLRQCRCFAIWWSGQKHMSPKALLHIRIIPAAVWILSVRILRSIFHRVPKESSCWTK